MRHLTLILVVGTLFACSGQESGKHLFILSGQSNMVGMRPAESFAPKVEAALGKDRVIIVKSAYGGQPIRRWYRDWRPATGNEPQAQPDLFDSLMLKVHGAIGDENIASITFVWMQGERDARESLGEVYERSLLGLHEQLCDELSRPDINMVIGRLSDFDMQNERYPHWTMVREAQVSVSDASPRFAWVDTDDLNDGTNRQGKSITNDLHLSAEGYKALGERFALQSLELIGEE